MFSQNNTDNEGGWWSSWRWYVSQGIGYVAISLSVMGELVGAHELAVAIMDKAAARREGDGIFSYKHRSRSVSRLPWNFCRHSGQRAGGRTNAYVGGDKV